MASRAEGRLQHAREDVGIPAGRMSAAGVAVSAGTKGDRERAAGRSYISPTGWIGCGPSIHLSDLTTQCDISDTSIIREMVSVSWEAGAS